MPNPPIPPKSSKKKAKKKESSNPKQFNYADQLVSVQAAIHHHVANAFLKILAKQENQLVLDSLYAAKDMLQKAINSYEKANNDSTNNAN